MSHELEMTTTVGGVAYASFAANGARADVWHRLGQYLGDRPMTTDEAMVAANMDRDVTVEPIGLPDGVEWGIPQKFGVFLDGKMGITPDGDLYTIPKKCVGIMGEGGADAHSNLSMRDRFEYAEVAQHITNGAAVWSTAGMLRNGTQGFACMEAPSLIIDPNGVADTVRQYLTVSWSFDGSRATELATSQVRVVCANTLAMHDVGKRKVVTVKHTSSAAKERLAQVSMQLAMHKDREAALKLKAERMLAVPNGRTLLTRFVEQVYLPSKDVDVSTRGGKKAVTARQNRIDDIEALFYASTNSAAVGDNGWAAWNTLVEYLDWYVPVKGQGDDVAARLQHQFDGTFDTVKSQFADFILQSA